MEVGSITSLDPSIPMAYAALSTTTGRDMAKLPLRALGLLLLTAAIFVPGCQALFHATTIPDVLEQQQQTLPRES